MSEPNPFATPFAGEWASEWPTEPGWYWTWQPSGHDAIQQPAHVYWAGHAEKRFLCYTAAGGFLFREENKSLLWGDRISVPEPPCDSAKTCFAVWMLSDMATRLYTEDGGWSLVHADAKIFETREAARDVVVAEHPDRGEDPDAFIIAIDDVDEFRSRGDTW